MGGFLGCASRGTVRPSILPKHGRCARKRRPRSCEGRPPGGCSISSTRAMRRWWYWVPVAATAASGSFGGAVRRRFSTARTHRFSLLEDSLGKTRQVACHPAPSSSATTGRLAPSWHSWWVARSRDGSMHRFESLRLAPPPLMAACRLPACGSNGTTETPSPCFVTRPRRLICSSWGAARFVARTPWKA